MKNLVYKIFLVAASVLLIACTGEPKDEAKDVAVEMEEFVVAVENQVENKTEMAWDSISMEYKRLENTLEKNSDKMAAETEEKIDKIRKRYEQAEDKWKLKIQKIDSAIDARVDSVDSMVDEI